MSTKVNRKKMIREAVARMKMLDICPDAIREFKEQSIVNYSDYGSLFWLPPRFQRAVKEFEEMDGGLVYHCIYNNLVFGECLTMLYISPHPEEWQVDRDDLIVGGAVAYVHNFTNPDFSEVGGVGVKPCFGGVLRTY